MAKESKYKMLCNACQWMGSKDDLIVRATGVKKRRGQVRKARMSEHCPKCDARVLMAVPKDFKTIVKKINKEIKGKQPDKKD